MTTFRQDFIFGARMLMARPGFTIAAVLSLALGIGANTTIFSLIINKTMADRFWEGQDPIGESVTLDFVPDEQSRVIVAVVGDSVIGRFQRQPTPMMYVPHLQQQNRWLGPSWDDRAMMAFVMRTDGQPMALASSVRSAVAEIDRSKPAGNIRTSSSTSVSRRVAWSCTPHCSASSA